jgi:hypothetical protein
MTARLGISKIAVGTGLLAIALAFAGCGGSSSKASAPNPAPTTTKPAATSPSTAAPVQTAAAKTPCEEAAPVAASPGEVGAGTGGSQAVKNAAAVEAEEHGGRGPVAQLPLSKADQATLDAQLAAAKTVIAKYPTVKEAVAAGYMMTTVYVPCIGAHYTNIGYASHFDPAHPSELLYAGTSLDSKIVGLSYLVWHSNGPPPGFAGPNDRWHQHNANGGLCIKGGVVVAGEDSTRQQCAAEGGRKTLLTDVWMVHAWIAPTITCTWGVFSGECPNLGGKLDGTATDGPYPSKFS